MKNLTFDQKFSVDYLLKCIRMEHSYLLVISFALLGGLVSTAGGLVVIANKRLAAMMARAATPFAAGALLGAAFFDLLPESLEHGAELSALRWAVVGLLGFFLLEQYLDWFHHHHEHDDRRHQPAVPLIVIGDTLHNLIDGIVIGSAFLISPSVGMVTTLAVAAHEIPQEIGDFSLLLKLGLNRRRVMWINSLSALATLVGALAVYALGSAQNFPLSSVLGVSAGMFIYIAASDLIPTIHAKTKGKFAHLDALLLIFGLLIVGILTDLAHQRIEPDLEANSEHHEQSYLTQ